MWAAVHYLLHGLGELLGRDTGTGGAAGVGDWQVRARGGGSGHGPGSWRRRLAGQGTEVRGGKGEVRGGQAGQGRLGRLEEVRSRPEWAGLNKR